MIGLEFICELHRKSYNSVADELGISRQSVYGWLKNLRSIPKKHLPKLSEIFGGLSEEYFQKELTDLDKLEIQKKKLNSEWDKVDFEYSIFDEDIQQNNSVIDTSRINEHFSNKQAEINYKIDNEKLHRNIQKTLDANFKNKKMNDKELEEYLNNNVYSAEDLLERECEERRYNANRILDTYKKFVKIIEKDKITIDTLNKVLDGLISYQDETNNDDEFTKEINKLVKDEEEKLNNRRHYNEQMYKILNKNNLFE